MQKQSLIVLSFTAVVAVAGSAAAAGPTRWTVLGTPERATVTGGPWVLAQGTAAFPTDNPGTNAMQPYYHAHVIANGTTLLGYFDYRPKDVAEAVVAATSTDGGKTWGNPVKKLYFVGDATTKDSGEGHPYVLTIAGHTYLYTLDRAAANVDSAGLIIHEITAGGGPLDGVPDTGAPGSTTATRTVGLVKPDGILGVVPGTSNPTSVLYLSKDTTATPMVTKLILVDTTDGINFTNPRETVGLNDPTTTTGTEWIGPRGTILKYADGRYGLFFSGGISADADADAFHYLGYAESSDAVHWTVVNGLDNPLLSKDAAKDPVQQPWYAGRIYAPSVVSSGDGCRATLLFAGYKTVKVKDAPTDYRQMGVVTLAQPCGLPPDMAVAPADMAVGGGGGGGGGGNGGSGGGGNGGSGGGGSGGGGGNGGGGGGGNGNNGGHGGCSTAPSATDAWPFALAGMLVVAALLVTRRRHDG